MKQIPIIVRTVGWAVAWAVSFSATGLFAQGIIGSAHDFSSYEWSGGKICTRCHTPKAAWNHAASEVAYTPFSSPTLNANDLGQPDGASEKCLSCHDGTVPVDAFGGNAGSMFMPARSQIGTDLRGHHPVSFTFDTALSVADGALNDPSATDSGFGGTIADDMLNDQSKVQCTTCHDQHGESPYAKFLVKPLDGAALCETCHNLPANTRGHHIPGRETPWNFCVLCHGPDLGGDLGPACESCHNDFLPPDPPPRGHNLHPGHTGFDITDRLDPFNNVCIFCHGEDLLGDLGPSCFTCHGPLWDEPLAVQPPVLQPPVLQPPANQPPVADAGGTYTGVAGVALTLDGSGSFDPDGTIVWCEWDFGDGTAATEINPSMNPSHTVDHTYAEPGDYTVGLTVTDDGGLTATATTTVDISASTTSPPGSQLGKGDGWAVSIPMLMSELTVTIEAFDGILLVQTTPVEGAPGFGIGVEFEGVIFWMDSSGALFFGNIDHDAGTMRGIVFGYEGGSSIWFAQRQ